jgi:xanthine dehydrogenase accessory factor
MDVLRRLVAAADAGRTTVLATVIEVRGSAPRGPGARMLVEARGDTTGTVGGGETEAAVIAAARALLAGNGPPRTLEVPTGCGGVAVVFLERLGAPRRLLVVGAGHVGRAVAAAAARASFAVTVIDRGGAPELAADESVRVLAAAEPAVLADCEHREETQVIVATGTHDADVSWAVAALAAGFSGVGVVGSRSKAATVQRAAAGAGLPAERLALLRCPVGLDLGGATPAELAVAIVAELVMLAHGREVPASWRKTSPA